MSSLRRWTTVLLIALIVRGTVHNANAEDNGLERTPVLSWSSWSFIRKLPTADKMKAQALALHGPARPEKQAALSVQLSHRTELSYIASGDFRTTRLSTAQVNLRVWTSTR